MGTVGVTTGLAGGGPYCLNDVLLKRGLVAGAASGLAGGGSYCLNDVLLKRELVDGRDDGEGSTRVVAGLNAYGPSLMALTPDVGAVDPGMVV